jgi:serine/threonine-protein kinase mTOR
VVGLGPRARRNDDVRARAARELCTHVAATGRERSGEAFTRYINDVNKRIFDLVNSSDPTDKLGGIAAIGAT